MTRFMDAELKILKLVDLLNISGGLQIEAMFIDTSRDEALRKPGLSVELSGADVPALLYNNAELLQAIQHIAAEILRLESPDIDWLWFDANRVKADKRSELELLARAGIQVVRTTSKPYRFPPMMSCERRLLHLALTASGFESVSMGFGFKRSVVLYPKGVNPIAHPQRADRSRHKPRAKPA